MDRHTRSARFASQSPSASATTTALSSSTSTSPTSACHTTPSSGIRPWPSSWQSPTTATTSSRCREVAKSSRSHVKREMQCAPSSAPSKLQQSTTPTAEVRALRRPSPRRSSCAAQDLRRMTSWREPRQDQRPSQGRLPPSHRKARPAPSSGRARGLSSRGPQTLPSSRGRRLGPTWRRATRHVFLRRT